MKSLQTINALKLMRDTRQKFVAKTVGFVPTMGFLHEGHLSLVRKAREENDKVIVSIFVNPTQFGPHEDLSRYPRDLARDVELLEKLNVDSVFTPATNALYPEDFQTFVEPVGKLVEEVEGAIRPGHFRGVATIVLKLFNIVQPTNVYFGQKDAQQALMIRKMIHDLNLAITMHTLPTIRETDGLAMSSRNVYLNKEERKAAGILYKALQKGKEVFDNNLNENVDKCIAAIKEIVETEPLAKLEYVELREPDAFSKLKTLTGPAILLISATVGKARLIDNFVRNADGTWNTGIRV